MLVLKAKDIEYCQLFNKKSNRKKIYRGGLYRGLLFVEIASFTLKQFEIACKKCRQLLDREEPINAILVREADRITLWSEASQLNFARQEDILISKQKNNLEIKLPAKFNKNLFQNNKQPKVKANERQNFVKTAVISLCFLLL